MPIRDMDMYASPRGYPPSLQGSVSTPLGTRVAANRGASGIDGVLSTAAGYAVGLARGVTLVVGDVSFVHDSNGLGLLRSGALGMSCVYRAFLSSCLKAILAFALDIEIAACMGMQGLICLLFVNSNSQCLK